jgi:hypothetical protein
LQLISGWLHQHIAMGSIDGYETLKKYGTHSYFRKAEATDLMSHSQKNSNI